MATESAVLVAVRSRPLLESDECGFNPALKFYKENKEVICHDKSFKFNYVFPPDSSNLTVYKTAVADRLEYIFNGYNLTILAYGQTGSGKSHTMGTQDTSEIKGKTVEDGIIPLSVRDIFIEINNRSGNKFSVKASFLEVYKEEIYDLLSKKGETCKIKEDFDGSQKVANLTEVPVRSVDDVMNVLRKGCHARRTGSTALNEHSSRSHSIFSLIIELNPDNLDAVKSKFQLIDLAGSERAERSRTEGIRFKEGCDINKGLLALGKVISGLCEEKSHIPYRDSKLTHLLMDSLGGNSYTLMIACISPSELSSEETLSTLRYALSARNIKNKPIINVDPPHIQIEKLKRQVEYLQTQLYKKSSSLDTTSSSEDFFNIKKQNEHLLQLVRKSTGEITDVSEKLLKAEEKADNYEKLMAICSDLEMHFIQDVDSASPVLLKLFEQIKSMRLKHEYLNPNVTNEVSSGSKGCEIVAESSEKEVFEDDVDLHEDIEKRLNDINDNLKKKEEMLNHFVVLNEVVDYSEGIEADISNMKTKIKELEKEKLNLQEKLKSSEKRFADECQKRVQECSCEIVGLQKKILKREHLQNIKVENDKKLQKFKLEITELKRAKVKLMKKMQIESENFRKMQIANQREVSKLKQNERKKDREIIVVRSNLEKQVNALRLKMERAQNLNKKYKEALNKREHWSALNRKKQSIGKENLQELLTKELDVEILSKLASDQYSFMKENISELAQKVQQFQQADKSSGSLQDLINMESAKLDKVKMETKNIAGKNKDRWSVINSMSDAKVALDLLFEKYISSYIEAYHQNEIKTSELLSLKERLESRDKKKEDEINNLKEKNKSLKERFEEIKDHYERELEKEKCERDIAMIKCLKSIGDVEKLSAKDTEHLNKLEVQEEEIQRLNERLLEYSAKCDEVVYWKEEYNKMCAKKRKTRKYLNDFPSQQSSSSLPELTDGSALFEYLDDNVDESFSSINETKDPDWRMTPLQKRRKRTRRETAILNTKNSEQNEEVPLPPKRQYFGCKCPSDCKTMRCGCRKKHQPCVSTCSCNKAMCLNYITEEENK